MIKKAANYFERQRYRLAYDEVSGVEVKEKDQDLKDRIYTVMYVERLYESYENNMKLGRADKALDALLRGIQKYDEHYDEAVELDIVKDIDSCRDKIINALWNTYGITEEMAYQILAMEGQEYTKPCRSLAQSSGDRDADRCAGTVINATIDRMNVTEDETMIAILDYDAYHLLNYLRFI